MGRDLVRFRGWGFGLFRWDFYGVSAINANKPLAGTP